MIDLSEHDVFFVPAQFARIQDAIDAIARPATIMIEPGVYEESFRVTGKEYVVIESTRLSRRGVVITGGAAIERSNVFLSGIELRSNRTARGIDAIDSHLSLQECVVAGNRATSFGGGLRCVRANVRLQKSVLAGNVIESDDAMCGGAGVYLLECKAEIAGCSIQTNEIRPASKARGAGVWCERSQLRLWRSRITENWSFAADSEGAGLYLQEPEITHLGGAVIAGNGMRAGRGGGVFVRGERRNLTIYSNTVIRQNHPDDVVEDAAD